MLKNTSASTIIGPHSQAASCRDRTVRTSSAFGPWFLGLLTLRHSTHMILSRREGMVAVHYVSNSWVIQYAVTTYRHTKRHLCYLTQRRLVDKDRSRSHDEAII